LAQPSRRPSSPQPWAAAPGALQAGSPPLPAALNERRASDAFRKQLAALARKKDRCRGLAPLVGGELLLDSRTADFATRRSPPSTNLRQGGSASTVADAFGLGGARHYAAEADHHALTRSALLGVFFARRRRAAFDEKAAR